MSSSEIKQKLIAQIKVIQDQITQANEKYEIQNKRIKFLKKENDEIKEKVSYNDKNSQDIRIQNQKLKKANKQLKKKFNDIKEVLHNSNVGGGPKTINLKNLIIDHHTQQIDMPKSQVNDQDLIQLKFFPKIKTLILGQNDISDEGLRIICQGCLNLKKLFLNHTKITDDKITYLINLKELTYLDLSRNNLTDKTILAIKNLKNLTQLSLSNNALTDKGIKQIQNLKQLRYLDITSNKLTSQSGPIFLQLKNLTNLYLSHNKINSVIVQKFMKELPQLRVLDLRFNDVSNQEKDLLRANKPGTVQIFL